MIKIKTADNTLVKITSAYIKTDQNTLTKIKKVYQVYDDAGVKSLRPVFNSIVPVLAPKLTADNFSYASEVIVNVEPIDARDTLEYRYTEYGLDGIEVDFKDWSTDNTFGMYGCSSYVKVEIRSVRDSITSTNESYFEYYPDREWYCSESDGDEDGCCDICGTEIEPTCDHTDTELNYSPNGDGTHEVTCACGELLYSNEDCSGGEATCTERATCDYCDREYGELGDHNYENGVCTVCSGTDDSGGDEWSCSHSSTGACGGCLSCHAGCNGEYNESSATCTEDGVLWCTECGADHGLAEALGGDHIYEIVDREDANESYDGYIEWYCTRCGDSYLETLHYYVEGNDHSWSCKHCGEAKE